jgi:hypothetical protein
MRSEAFRLPLHLLLVFSLLFSAAEVSRVGLFTTALFADNDCGNILCTCGSSCSCGLAERSTGKSTLPGHNKAGIPQIYPTGAEKTGDSCCPENPDAAAEQNEHQGVHAGQQASVCDCGQLPGDEESGLIKPLEKTVFLAGPPALLFPDFYVLKFAWLHLSHPAFPDEVFHPPASA